MTRREIIDLLASEVAEIIKEAERKNPRDNGFDKRKAEGILDLILGLGMNPPKEWVLEGQPRRHKNRGLE